MRPNPAPVSRTHRGLLFLLVVLGLLVSLAPGQARASKVPTAAPDVTEISLPTNDLAYDPVSGKLYASIPGNAGPQLGNRVVAIDPETGALGPPVLVGSEPRQLAIAGNGEFLYVGLDGAAAVRRVHLPTFTAGLQFSLGVDQSTGPYFVEDIEVQPGDANTVAVSRRNVCCSPKHEGVAIYENGVKRPSETPGHLGANAIEFGSSPGPLGAVEGRLYGYDNESTEYGFRRMSVSPSGVSVLDLTRNLIQGFFLDIEFADGRIYATNGRVVDPSIPALAGTYAIGTARAVEPVPDHGKVFFIAPNSAPSELVEFDLETFTLVDSYPIAGIGGTPSSLVATDNGNLAFRTSAGEVFLIRFHPADDFGTVPPDVPGEHVRGGGRST